MKTAGKAKAERTLGERLIHSLQQAVLIHQGKMAPARSYYLPYTGDQVEAAAAPSYAAGDVIAIRKGLELSQAVFAQALNVSVGTVRSWEQGDKPPRGPSRRLLEIATRAPEVILATIVPRPLAPARVAAVREPTREYGRETTKTAKRGRPKSS